MRKTSHWVEVLGIGVSILAASCSSSKSTDTGNQGSGYNPGNGQTAADGFPTAQSSTDPNGLMQVTAAEATNLQNAATVCQGWQSTPQGGPAIMEFIIDISTSMTTEPSVTSNANSPTKWAVFSQTLPNIFAGLPSSFAVGVMYFSAQTGQCYAANRADVPIATLDATQLAALENSVRTVATGGDTPTYQAWNHAYGLVTNWTPGANDSAALATAGRYLVLVTDGVPTVGQTACAFNQNGISTAEFNAEITLIGNATTASKTTFPPNGVETFVVGVPGSNNPQGASFDPMYMLSLLAVAGGTATPAGCVPKSGTVLADDVNPRGTYCYYDLSQTTDLATSLTSALGNIASSVLSCTYTVPPAPAGQTIDPNKTILVFTDGATGNTSVVLQNTSSTCDKGWQFADSSDTTIKICGTSCTAIQANPKLTLSLVFGCTAGQIIVN